MLDDMRDEALVSGPYEESPIYQYFLKMYNENMKNVESEEQHSNMFMARKVLNYILKNYMAFVTL